MKSLERNSKVVNIAYYYGKQPSVVAGKSYEVDKWDLPIETNLNVFVPSGEITVQLFGTTDNYDLIATSCDTSLQINENTKFWIDTIPNNATENNDYVVKNVKYSINSIAIGLVKKPVSNIKTIWLSYYDEETTTYAQPYKIRISVEENDDDTITLLANKNDYVPIDENTIFWYRTIYNESLSNFDYVYKSKQEIGNVIKYILDESEES